MPSCALRFPTVGPSIALAHSSTYPVVSMLRSRFLAQPDVKAFIDWLCLELPRLTVQLNFSRSRYVPMGLKEHVVGIESLLPHYCWKTRWQDPVTGHWVTSQNWSQTQASLALLHRRLQAGLLAGNDLQVFKACVAILQWGGVRGALVFLRQLMLKHDLVAYLTACQPLFDLAGSQRLSALDSRTIRRFDAGLTKIHALVDVSGSPIYDSRVGAAIAMLYALYRQTATCPAVLDFPSGAARGKQIRNPGELGYANAPQFFSPQVPREKWARAQVQLGWIIREVLTRTSLFQATPPQPQLSIRERCHAFEASLFMLGYDLRCFLRSTCAPSPAPTLPKKRGWVPTGHPFAAVLKAYLAFRQQNPGITFLDWLISQGRPASTARAYGFPLRAEEFDLPACSLDSLKTIVDGGEAGLLEANGGVATYFHGEEREQVCLVNAWLAGRAPALARAQGLSTQQWLIGHGYAGTPASANTLLSVGRGVGRHFDLLTEDNQPTEFFERFFGPAPLDI